MHSKWPSVTGSGTTRRYNKNELAIQSTPNVIKVFISHCYDPWRIKSAIKRINQMHFVCMRRILKKCTNDKIGKANYFWHELDFFARDFRFYAVRSNPNFHVPENMFLCMCNLMDDVELAEMWLFRRNVTISTVEPQWKKLSVRMDHPDVTVHSYINNN